MKRRKKSTPNKGSWLFSRWSTKEKNRFSRRILRTQRRSFWRGLIRWLRKRRRLYKDFLRSCEYDEIFCVGLFKLFLDSFWSAWWTTQTGKRRLENHGKRNHRQGKQQIHKRTGGEERPLNRKAKTRGNLP